MNLTEPLSDDQLAAEVYRAAAFSISGLIRAENLHPAFKRGVEAAADRCRELADLAERGLA